MWIEGKLGVDDDLMEDWLLAVIKAGHRGITGEKLATTLTELVDHLSAGKREVIKRPLSPRAIQRYDLERFMSCGGHDTAMIEHPDGDWVKFEDIQAALSIPPASKIDTSPSEDLP